MSSADQEPERERDGHWSDRIRGLSSPDPERAERMLAAQDHIPFGTMAIQRAELCISNLPRLENTSFWTERQIVFTPFLPPLRPAVRCGVVRQLLGWGSARGILVMVLGC
jgi:hypothetical protein